MTTLLILFSYLRPGLRCLSCLLFAHMIEMKLLAVTNSTAIEGVICVLEDTRRSIVSRNHGEPGNQVELWRLAMDNTGRLPVCRGLVSEKRNRHALRLAHRVAADSLKLTDRLKELWRPLQPCTRMIAPRITAR